MFFPLLEEEGAIRFKMLPFNDKSLSSSNRDDKPQIACQGRCGIQAIFSQV